MVTKRIGIDARLIAQTGVGVYIRNLLYELSKIDDGTFEFLIYVRAVDKKDLPDLPKKAVIRCTNAQWHSLAEQTVFLRQLLSDKIDLMHFCYFSMPIFYNRPFVITIHDVIPFKYPTGKASTKSTLTYTLKHAMYKKVLLHALAHAKRIFVPSEAVKNDISRLFPHVKREKIARTYEGVDYSLRNAKEEPVTLPFEKPLFLYMGNFYPHKNVETLVKAFSKSKSNAQLILSGPDDFFAKKIGELITDMGASEKISLLSNLSIEQRAYLYKKALALVHPSKDEGFGLSLLESAYFNCPAIVSDIPVLREIRPAAMFFRPDSITELTELLDETASKGKVASTDTIHPDFSFKKLAQTTYNQYIEIV